MPPALTVIVAALLVQLPFPGSPVLFTAFAMPVSLRAVTAVAALLAAGRAAWRRNRPFDALDWALLAWGCAWVAAGLAAPWNFPAALREALRPAGAALLAIGLRAGTPESLGNRAGLMAWAAVAAGVLAVAFARPAAAPSSRAADPVPRPALAAAARLAFSQHPVFGWGPGQFREWTPRWLAKGPRTASANPPGLYHHVLADGGLAAAAALAVLLMASAIALVPRLRRRGGGPAVAASAGMLLWLGWGLHASTLLPAEPQAAALLALGLGTADRR